MSNTQNKHEFLLTLDGINLDKATLAKIGAALQQAFLIELSSLDLNRGALVYTPVMSTMIAEDISALPGRGSSGGAMVSVRPPSGG